MRAGGRGAVQFVLKLIVNLMMISGNVVLLLIVVVCRSLNGGGGGGLSHNCQLASAAVAKAGGYTEKRCLPPERIRFSRLSLSFISHSLVGLFSVVRCDSALHSPRVLQFFQILQLIAVLVRTQLQF